MAGLGIAAGGGGGGRLAPTTVRTPTSGAAGDLIVSLRNPFPGATAYAVVGTVPDQLELVGRRLLRRAAALGDGQGVTVRVRATSADGLRDLIDTIRVVGISAPAPTPAPQPAATMLPALEGSAHYHAVYANERLLPGYAGPLAAVVAPDGAVVDIGLGRTGLTPALLPQPVTPLYGWYDQTGSGARNIMQTDAALRPRLRGDVLIGDALALAFPGVGNVTGARAVLTAAQALAANDRTEIFVIDPSYSIQSAAWSTHADAAMAIRRLVYTSPDNHGTLKAAQRVYPRPVRAQPQVLIVVETPSGSAVYVDGTRYAVDTPGDVADLVSVSLGWLRGSETFNASFRLAAYIAVAGAIEAGEARAITAALAGRYAIDPAATVNLVHVGDSMVQGVGATDTIGLKAALLAGLTRRTAYFNLGIAGKTLASCFADRALYEATMVDPGKTNIALLDGGINDLGAGRSGLSLHDDVARPYVAALKAMGYRVGIVTLLPTTTGVYPTAAGTIEQERTAYNRLLRGGTAGHDFLVDRAAHPLMGAYPAGPDDPSLYDGQHLHPTSRGYGLIAALYSDAINAHSG